MFKKLGDFQVSLLLCLVRLGGNAKGFEIENSLEELLDREILAPQVLGALQRLERRKFVEIVGAEVGEKGGRPRNVYSITEAGKSALTGMLEEHYKRQSILENDVLASEHLAKT